MPDPGLLTIALEGAWLKNVLQLLELDDTRLEPPLLHFGYPPKLLSRWFEQAPCMTRRLMLQQATDRSQCIGQQTYGPDLEDEKLPKYSRP